MLRPATPYEVVAALLHHQPAAAFSSLFVLHGYGHDLCTNFVAAELAEIETVTRGVAAERDYELRKVIFRPLQSERRIDLSRETLSVYCFDQCSIRQFPVFFVLRDPAQQNEVERLMAQTVGYTTVRHNDWRLENAYEWAILSREARAGTLVPRLEFPLMDALGWRLVRPITEMGGRSPILEWHLLKAADLNNAGAIPLMTVLTNPEGHVLRRADAQMLHVFRAKSGRQAPVTVALAADRLPLMSVTTRVGEPASPVPAPSQEAPMAPRENVVPLQRLAI